ncbi:MAG: hypothetical protein KDC38_04140 [Planctomycetes bacterium]|nr:hypothetical protein [Planctomycetota bacterium]
MIRLVGSLLVAAVVVAASYGIALASDCKWDPSPGETMPATINLPSCSTAPPGYSAEWTESADCQVPWCFSQVETTMRFDTTGGVTVYTSVGSAYSFDAWRYNPPATPQVVDYTTIVGYTAGCSGAGEHVDAQQVVWCYDSQGNLSDLTTVWKSWGVCRSCLY